MPQSNWRLSWLESLFEFASTSMQEMLWTGNSIGVQASFDECICGYFDDLGLERGYAAFIRNGLVSEQEAAIVAKFHDMVDGYKPPSRGNDLAVLDDPLWAELAAEAQRAWLSLRSVIGNDKELARMAELETQWGSFAK